MLTTWRKPDLRYALLATLPALMLIFAVIIYPLLYAVALSFQGGDVSRPSFVGLVNYTQLLADPDFRAAAVRTLLLTLVAVVLTTLLSLGIALVINEGLRGHQFLKVALLLPYALPGALNAVIWRWIYDPYFGIINYFLLRLGLIKEYISFTGDPRYALWSIILAFVWHSLPYTAFLIVAGLTSIPRSVYEAAQIDCASGWTVFRRITLPLIQPVLRLTLIIQTVFAVLLHFGLVFVITGGGPGNATTTIPWYVYLDTFTHMRFGRGSAGAVVLSLIMLVFIYVYLVAMRSSEEKVR